MRLVRFGPRGSEKPGLLIDDGVVDLRSIFPDIPDIGEAFFRGDWLRKIDSVRQAHQLLNTRLGCPISQPSKIICLARNYAEHAKEGGSERPDKPLLFVKSPNVLNGPCDPILLPRSCGQIDWEVELAVIIGKEGKRINSNDAYRHIAGYTIMNDVSGRQAQFSDSQWYRGKSFDTFAPMGPAIVTLDEVGDPHDLKLMTRVDGQVMQAGTTANMIFDIPTLVAYISEDITLIPGDVISTGTPSGVGIFRDPPITLQPGNIVECRIEKIGAIKNKVVSRLHSQDPL
jgi:2-keto-4-pentenoate hydratase/2-oxohepta-3-ene-1,7-dioic acid hydratase in catechol pathway